MASRLAHILRKKETRKAGLESALDLILAQLKKMGALKVILFGSLAGGDVDVTSDLDLLVIMPATRTAKQWMKRVYETVERGVASDILVYTPEEFEQTLPGSHFLQNVVKTGRVVHEKAV